MSSENFRKESYSFFFCYHMCVSRSFFSDLQMMLKSVVILHVVDISRCTHLNEVINLNELEA